MALKILVQVWTEIDPTLNVRIERSTGEPLAEAGDALRRISPLGRTGVAAAIGQRDAQVAAFAISEQHRSALRWALAAGANQAIELLSGSDNPTASVDQLSNWFENAKPDLVIADSRAGLCAGRLGWSHLAGLENLQVEDRRLRAIRRIGRGEREIVIARLPAIVRLQTESLHPPYISRARIHNVSLDAIRRETLKSDSDESAAAIGPLRIARPRVRGTARVLHQSERGMDRLAALMTAPDKPAAQSSTTDGPRTNATCEQLADEFVRYLLHHNLLPPLE